VAGGIAIGSAQVGHQELITAEDVQRQETIVIVIAVEEASLLMAVDRIVRSVKVQDKAFGRRLERGDESLHEDFGHLKQGTTRDTVLQATEGGSGGEGVLAVGGALSKGLPEGIVSEGGVVVEILVAKSDAKDALGKQGALGVCDPLGIARIRDSAVQGIEQAKAFIDLAQEQSASIRGERTAREVDFKAALAKTGKGQGFCATLCHRSGCLLGG